MKEKVIVFAGQPNTGKSSWINLISGSHLITGNWSGVTIEKNESIIEFHEQIYHLIDLPGIQGLDQQSDEERITEEFLYNNHIDCLVQVMDSTHMESSMTLMMKLRNLQIPMICLLNFKDEAISQHIMIDTEKLMRRCSIPMIWTSIHQKQDKELVLSMIEVQCQQRIEYRPLLNPDADRIFESFYKKDDLYSAIRKFEQVYEQLAKKERHDAVKSCMKYVSGSMKKANREILKKDRFLLCTASGKIVLVLGLFLSLMILLWIGNQLSGFFDFFLNSISSLFHYHSSIFDLWMTSVLFEGIGSLIGFIPQLFCFYIWVSILEESGLMIRISLLLDSIMRSFQLSGKSWISLIISHGCNAAAVVHTVSLESEPLRRKCALLVPFCSCSALIPVYLYFNNIIFQRKGLLILFILTGLGCLTVLFLSILIQKLLSIELFEQQIIELVPYRKVQISTLIRKSVHQVHQYFDKIIKVMFFSLNIIWLMSVVKIHEVSLLEHVSKCISPIFNPLGFGKNWIYTASLISSIFAKESSVVSLSMLNKMSGTGISCDYSLNLSYLVFLSLSCGCTMTLTMMKQKYGFKLMMLSIVLSFTVSYFAALFIYHFTMLF